VPSARTDIRPAAAGKIRIGLSGLIPFAGDSGVAVGAASVYATVAAVAEAVVAEAAIVGEVGRAVAVWAGEVTRTAVAATGG
jgi:hypothetical protein